MFLSVFYGPFRLMSVKHEEFLFNLKKILMSELDKNQIDE